MKTKLKDLDFQKIKEIVEKVYDRKKTANVNADLMSLVLNKELRDNLYEDEDNPLLCDVNHIKEEHFLKFMLSVTPKWGFDNLEIRGSFMDRLKSLKREVQEEEGKPIIEIKHAGNYGRADIIQRNLSGI